ncbi:LPS assembly lipoprotein LptE [Planctomicrobium sp. SH664]|uniref:LPS assembly lipoprotein LptE n=1 Tax=Planctomicrobium sp. SH664 TaxID=3448125 RepID=UPI003F5B86A8
MSRLLNILSRRTLLAVGLFWLIGIQSGCGYLMGNPMGPEVRTVHVPTFTNETFRRGYELRLTEAVQKQIALTPFKLVGPDQADTRLSGRIIDVGKRNINQNKYDDGREYEFSIAIEVTWEDLRTGTILAQRQMPVGALVADAIANTSFAPEPGQSQATATQNAVDQLARQIVGLMEVPW